MNEKLKLIYFSYLNYNFLLVDQKIENMTSDILANLLIYATFYMGSSAGPMQFVSGTMKWLDDYSKRKQK